MADFGELCPLFNTGVFSEVTFPNIPMTAVSTTSNALAGTLTYTVTKDVFTFGRTVVVTDALMKRNSDICAAQSFWLAIATSAVATMSAFATMMMALSISFRSVGYTWIPFTFLASRTFTSTDVLCLTVGTVGATGAGTHDLIVRYREK